MDICKDFISGDDAVAIGVKLARPDVIAAYPITPQTIVVERLSEYVEDGSLDSKYIHVESEHSAIMAVLGASAMGSRTFTATSSQGLLYMAEGLPYVSGSRFPMVMMNANRATAVPWSIYNDHNDAMFVLNSGWLQLYVEDAQEALDSMIQAYKIAEDPNVMTPIMINLDGFILTHTYELVDIPEQKLVDAFLPPYVSGHKMSLENPQSVCIGVGPDMHTEFRYKQHRDLLRAAGTINAVDRDFEKMFGRSYGGMVESYRCEDAEAILVTVGSVTATARAAVKKMRGEGHKVGLVKLRYVRPFPTEEIISIGKGVKAVGVVDKNISYGFEGSIFTNVNSALKRSGVEAATLNFIAGLGGRNISSKDIEAMFLQLLDAEKHPDRDVVRFVHLNIEEAE
ncbi:MAG: pyruvate ferredoxin oxidoreductase [Clostridiales Family XIII bacterium]|jgi:pyruvate ferredoxin oxidoreductase alpha subunit|nr:pyruvate ferredoxin oxidoreductase [Clostridiales Family XIII bacterium]